MNKRLGTVALECFFDLGITVVYAILVGFLIVGNVATDEAPVSILSASLYAAALPGSALALILAEILLRAFKERRETRHLRRAETHVLVRTAASPRMSR